MADDIDLRLQELKEQLEGLNEKIFGLRSDLGHLAPGGLRIQVEYEVKRAEEERHKVVQEIETLESQKLGRQLYNALLRLNFQKQVGPFKGFMEHQNRTGAFLIHGPDERYCQSWLLNRLYRLLQRHSTTSKVIQIDLTRQARRNDIKALWYELGGRVGLTTPKRPVAEVVKAVHQCWKTQNVILVFYGVDGVSSTHLSQLIHEFWEPLTNPAQNGSFPASDFLLLMFLIDNSGCVAEWKIGFVEELDSTWKAHVPVKLPMIQRFSADVLVHWLENSIEDLPHNLTHQVDHTAQSILDSSENGIPQLALERICNLCGYNWYEGESQWLKL
jgi:hypothetical protein